MEGAIVVQVGHEGQGAFGDNAAFGLYQDLVEAAAVDPTEAVRVARQNAASLPSLMLTTEALIADRRKHGTTTSDQENS